MAALDEKPKIVVVCGPTATGKTDLALTLCRAFGGTVVGADSMQIYKGLPVGTAALEDTDAPDVPRRLMGFLPPEKPFSVAEYVAMAKTAIADIRAEGRLPVVCGGTGLYIESLVMGTSFTGDKTPPGTLERLEAQWRQEGGEAMLARLGRVDPAHAQKLAPMDKNRILRSLAQFEATGMTNAVRLAASRPETPPYAACLLGLTCERPALYRRINERVDVMLTKGLLAEARWVYDNRAAFATAGQAIGYKEFFPYFEGAETLEACADALKQATRRYAKRQLTWFGRMEGVRWLEAGPEAARQAESLVGDYLNGKDHSLEG